MTFETWGVLALSTLLGFSLLAVLATRREKLVRLDRRLQRLRFGCPLNLEAITARPELAARVAGQVQAVVVLRASEAPRWLLFVVDREGVSWDLAAGPDEARIRADALRLAQALSVPLQDVAPGRLRH